MKNLLVHACCGPCLIYPYALLREDRRLSVYYFNPNIQPSMEYIRRLEALAGFCKINSIELKLGEYDPTTYFRQISGNENDRCRICYSTRLGETARYAAENGYDEFTTTLAVSPYQNHDLLRSVGEDAAKRFQVGFVYIDFRDGFRESQSKAVELGLYRQSYCGCIYSEVERYRKKLEQVVEKIGSGDINNEPWATG